MTLPAYIPLQGRFVRLEPFIPRMKEEMRAVLDCDADTWDIMPTSGMGEHFDKWWAGAMAGAAKSSQMPFAVRRLSDARLIGTSSFLLLRPDDRGASIGATFIHPDGRAGFVNPEIKRLMLAHAFDAGVIRVEFMVDTRNRRSLAAVKKLGATLEGVMRRHKITWTGYVRDTAVHSITDQDWPAVRDKLDERLAAFT